jgi:hypothetical protein
MISKEMSGVQKNWKGWDGAKGCQTVACVVWNFNEFIEMKARNIQVLLLWLNEQAFSWAEHAGEATDTTG